MYNSTQSLNQLITELQSGHIPDFVVFYDGANEVSAPYNNQGIPNAPFNQQYIREGIVRYVGLNKTSFILEFLPSNFYLLHPLAEGLYPAAIAEPEPPQNILELADDIVQVYLANYQTVEAMSTRFDFDFGFFWQPVSAVSNKTLTPMETQTRDVF